MAIMQQTYRQAREWAARGIGCGFVSRRSCAGSWVCGRRCGMLACLVLAGWLMVAQDAFAAVFEVPVRPVSDARVGSVAVRERGRGSQDEPEGIPPGLRYYKGREIAQTMHYMGAPWLTREEREAEEKCSLMLANCKIRPGMTVCDMGCGNGFYTFRLAEMVGPKGLVYAVDIQPEMLVLLRQEMERRGVENIVPVLGSVHNPRLPADEIDAILLADVYHEFSHPEQMLAAMRSSLRPDGFAILLEFRAEDPRVPIKPLHKMSKRQVMAEWPPNGFKLLDEFDGLTWQHMMFFGRDGGGEERADAAGR